MGVAVAVAVAVAVGLGVPVAVAVAVGVGDAPVTFAVIEKSSTARPSSAPVASTSLKRMKKVAPFGMFRPVIVEEMAVRLAAALPSSAPAVPAVTGGLKSRAFASKYVPVDKSVALRLY